MIQARRENSGGGEMPAILNSHPLDRQRLAAIAEMARARGWSGAGQTTPLPRGFDAWMKDAAGRAAAVERQR